jgi:DNA-binding NarL/FixJ family response regulator
MQRLYLRLLVRQLASLRKIKKLQQTLSLALKENAIRTILYLPVSAIFPTTSQLRRATFIMISILIADDHTIMREGLKRILGSQDDFVVVGEATNGFEVMDWVRDWVKKGGFEVLLLDLSMPGKSGVDLIKQIKIESPKLPILVLTMHEEEHYAVRTIRAGASGYLTKESAATLLVEAIRRVAAGRLYISPSVAEQLALNIMPSNEDLPHKRLSDREFEVFQMLAAGTSVSEIAEKLHLSVKTVSTHKTRILQKMDAHSLADLVKYAMVNNLLSD